MRPITNPSASNLDHLKNTSIELTSYSPLDLDEQRDASASDKATRRRHVPNNQGVFKRIFCNWWAELLAGVIIILSFGGLLAVLRTHQDKPLPNWPLGFSLNTALAVFGVIFRAPIIFIAVEGIGQLKWQWFSKTRPLSELSDYDNATRGPWGATKLVWIARWRNLLATLGAFIIVVSFGIEPFTQAVVRYNSCDVQVKGNASIGHVNSYFSQRAGYNLPTWARLAIDASFGDQTTIMPNSTCTTRSCNFPDLYHSVGLCSKCVDLTDQLNQTCNSDDSFPACNYTLPRSPKNPDYGTRANYQVLPSPARRSLLGNRSALWNAFSARKFSSLEFRDNQTSALSDDGTAPDFQSSTVDFVSASPALASRCYLYYCTRTYSASIESTRLIEKLHSTNSNWSTYTEETRALGTVSVSCLKSNVQAYLAGKGYISTETEWMAWNGAYLNGTETQEGISQSTDLTIPAKCVYQAQVVNSIMNWYPDESFTDGLTGTLKGTGPEGSIKLDTNSSTLLAGLYQDGKVTVDSLNQAFENFTTVVSNYMRTRNEPIPRNISGLLPVYVINPNLTLNHIQGKAEDQNQPIIGENTLSTTCIHVRWPWLALPAAIFVGTLIFLILLIAKTAMSGDQEVWKSSQNALIWHSLSGTAEKESVALDTSKEMDVRAKEIMVQLRQTKKGWKLAQDE